MEENKRNMINVSIVNKNIKVVKCCSRDSKSLENNEYYFGRVLDNDPLGVLSEGGYGFVRFQNGTVPEKGVNGIQIEDLIEVCIDRLQVFQSANLSRRQNALAITKLEEALHWLQARASDRQRRWVAGTHEE